MTIEERLKTYILSRYGTLKAFAEKCGLPYGTVDTILRRGIMNSNVQNILTICETLGISADDLANGTIAAPATPEPPASADLIQTLKGMFATGAVTIGGVIPTDAEADQVLKAVEIVTEMIRRDRK